jgi:hypothetical protein
MVSRKEFESLSQQLQNLQQLLMSAQAPAEKGGKAK